MHRVGRFLRQLGLVAGVVCVALVATVGVAAARTERDVTPPGPPRLHVGPRTQTSVSLSWYGHTDNDTTAPLTYLLSTPHGERTYQEQWEDRFESLTPGVPYTFTIRARDRSGNVSEPASVTVTLDATPPSPPTGLTYNPATRVLSWPASTDNIDSAFQLTYRVYADGQPVHLIFDAPARGETNVDLGLELDCGNPVPNGTYTVTAMDLTGNASAPGSPVEVRL